LPHSHTGFFFQKKGKSTLFNALAQKSIAQAENFPFCTIDPNRVPIAMMPDKYLQSLGTLAKSQKTIPASIELVDVAGLVAGASRGEGLGNQFLATVRECDAIIHVIRHFDDTNISRVNGDGDGASSPLDDAEVVNLELLLADIAHVERRLEKTTCQKEERDTLEFLLPELRKGIPARAAVVKGGLSAEQEFSIKSMGLLTLKPVIYAFNVDEVDFLFDKDNIMKGAKGIFDSIQYCDPARDLFTIVSAKLAARLRTTNNPGETREYLQSVGFDDIAHGDDDDANQELDSIMGYNDLLGMIRQLLDLFVVYVGPGVAPERSRTTRAFLMDGRKSKISSSASHSSTTALGLAGRLHGDIQKGFIRAEVIPACQLLEFSSYKTAKDAGVVRTEGKDYVLQADDVVLIKWK
jgi:ribosome-binding ATPase